jgi:hypothetical protein
MTASPPAGSSTSMIAVRLAKRSDAAAWLQLRHALWPEGSEAAQPDNEVSAAAHRALGFVEVGLVRCFRKDL